VHLAAKDDAGYRAADQCRRDVVEKRRQHEDHHQQDERALPVIGKQLGKPRRHLARLEVPGEERKAQQEAEQVREQYPLVHEMQHEPRRTRTFGKRRERDLVERDHDEAGDGDFQRVMVEQRHADQRERKEDEVDGNARNRRWLREFRGECDARQQQCCEENRTADAGHERTRRGRREGHGLDLIGENDGKARGSQRSRSGHARRCGGQVFCPSIPAAGDADCNDRASSK